MRAVPPQQTYTRAALRRAAGATDQQLRAWEKSGLIAPAEHYSFADLIALRTLTRLKACDVSTRRMAKILGRLRARLGEIKNPLTELKLTPDGKRIRVQIGALRMDADSGQFLLDFADGQIDRLVRFPVEQREKAASERKRREAENWFQKGLELEQVGAPIDQAMDAYRLAIALDPALAAAMVNLGTIHFTARNLDQAEKYYTRAIEANGKYALAHFNLGNLYDERGDRTRAVQQYQAALKLDASYADAHYNLGLLYQNLGQVMKAVRHWRAYLRLDPASSWADIARRELEKIYSATLVRGKKTS